jgi:hypothetical protein
MSLGLVSLKTGLGMSERYMKEIEEILKRARGEPPRERFPKRGPGIVSGLTGLFTRPFRGRWWRLSPGKLMLGGVALLLVALILHATIPFTVGPVVWAGLALFILAYALFFIRAGTTYEKRWRGRPIEPRPSFWQRVRRWFTG